MKKSILFFAMSFMVITSAFSRDKSYCIIRNRGTLRIWFDEIYWGNDNSGLTINQTCLNCKNPGDLQCIPTNAAGGYPTDFDTIDILQSEELLKHRDSQLEKGILQGEKQVTIRVAGENFTRVYTIKWTTEPNGDGYDVISRRDV